MKRFLSVFVALLATIFSSFGQEALQEVKAEDSVVVASESLGGSSVVVSNEEDIQNLTIDSRCIKEAGNYLTKASDQMFSSFMFAALGAAFGSAIVFGFSQDFAFPVGTGVIVAGSVGSVILSLSAVNNIGKAGLRLSGSK